MEMTEHEICSRYRWNKGKRRMITVLAELNAVDDEVICRILLKNNLIKKMPKVLHEYQFCG